MPRSSLDYTAFLIIFLGIISKFTEVSSFHSRISVASSQNACYVREFRGRSSNCLLLRKLRSTASDDTPLADDSVFGAEFQMGAAKGPEEEKTYWRGNIQYTEISAEKRGKVMKGYDNLRITFLLDNLFISALGLCLLWGFGTYKDAFSYGVGSLLGTGYAALLARYVESLGSKQGGGAGGGAARFAPVVLLILLYSKNKDYISIVPEIMGFFTFQVASLLQIFNEDAYGESEQK
jgi:hypothetical protein